MPLAPSAGVAPGLAGPWDLLADMTLPCSVGHFWHVFLSDASQFLPTFYSSGGGRPVRSGAGLLMQDCAVLAICCGEAKAAGRRRVPPVWLMPEAADVAGAWYVAYSA